jgi:DNA adenine methylase
MTPQAFPKQIDAVHVPPVKCQGIKSKLVSFIAKNIQWDGRGRWIEPFLGSGVVALNLRPTNAILSDTNQHVINLYRAIQAGKITHLTVRDTLRKMGACLKRDGEKYFYEVRDRFNDAHDPLDLLFLNRSCFNGIMRFNGKGRYNVPFGKKTERFRPAYVTKIVNQVHWLQSVLKWDKWEIKCCDWRESLAEASADDFVYVDPPYIGRHTDYFNRWSDADAVALAQACSHLPCGFALSMWYENQYRKNSHIHEFWGGATVRTYEHFYHVGPTESLRNSMIEALVIREGFAAPLSDETDGHPEERRKGTVQTSLF